MLTTMVENFPGFRDGVMGPELMAEMRAQAERFGTEIIQGNVTNVELSRRPLKLEVSDHLLYSETLIVATGATSRLLGLPSERKLLGHGVSTAQPATGFLPREADCGGGRGRLGDGRSDVPHEIRVEGHHRPSARHAARLEDHAGQGVRKSEDRFCLEQRDRGHSRHVQGFRDQRAAARYHHGERSDLPVDGVFIAIGHTPNTALFRGQLEMDANGYIITHQGTHTSVPGVFACGDVQDHIYRQAITAAGTGCMAAIDAEHYLDHIPEDVNAELTEEA